MVNLTAIGLAFDLVGAIILLGPEYRPVEQSVKRLDPIYRSVNYGMQTLYREGTVVDDGTKKTEGSMSAGHWKFLAARRFLNKRIKREIDSEDEMSLGGVGIRRNGEEIKLPEMHQGTVYTDVLSTTVVRDWLEELQERRMYRIGGTLLVGGFAIQLIAQFV